MYIPKSEYYELPNEYSKTVIRLLIQSPSLIFAYWEVSEDTIKMFKNRNINFSNCIPILKIKNITMNYSYDIPIDPFANNYYIEVKDPDCEYQVELGRKYKNEFINIYTSNSAKVPRSSPIPIEYSEQVVYRNCIKLNVSDKFTVYYKKNSYNIDGSRPQDYNELSFDDSNDSIDSSGSFARYENSISSLDNMSSFTRYQDNENVSSYERYKDESVSSYDRYKIDKNISSNKDHGKI